MSQKADCSEVKEHQTGQNCYFKGYHVRATAVYRPCTDRATPIIMSNRTFWDAPLQMLIVLVKNGVFPVRMLMREPEMQAFPVQSLRRQLTNVKYHLL